jgi:hypothetical protein
VQVRDQRRLHHDAGAAAGKLAGDPLINVRLPTAAPQHQCGQKSAHRTADDERAPLRHADTLLI